MPSDGEDRPIFTVDLGAEVERFFDDSSLAGEAKPRFVLLLGGVSSGKTYTRRRQCKRGFVIVDAAEIFISLSRGGYYDFPDGLLDPLEAIGSLVALRAVAERRNVVTEMLATDLGLFEGVFRAMVAAGYQAEPVWIECDPAEAARRNASRGDLDISAAFCQEFHSRWLLAATAAGRPDDEPKAADWRHDRLAAAFPTQCPEAGGVPTRPIGAASGSGRFDDEEQSQEFAEVDISIVPSADLVIRLRSWPPDLTPRDPLERALVRGLLKATCNLVTPPACGCEITVNAIRCGPHPTERALHVAAYRAFERACLGCQWELAAPFPVIAPTPDEDLDLAFGRITGSFEAAGFRVDRSADTALSATERLSMRAFYVHVWVEKGGAAESHVFFVCPLPWQPQRVADFNQARARLSYNQAHDGFATRIHVLSAWPERAPT